MVKRDEDDSRTRRTREHVIASQSVNCVEKFIVDKGHTAERQIHDYGIDLIVSTYDEEGYLEAGLIRIQLKASDVLAKMRRPNFISYKLSSKHYGVWRREVEPVFLVLYDAQERKAYWLYLQAYFALNPGRRPRKGARTFTVHVPVANEFTEQTVDYMRASKAAILARYAGADPNDQERYFRETS